MILDSLNNLMAYAALNPRFEQVIDFLKANDIVRLAPGKYPVGAQGVWLNICDAQPKTQEQARLETHNEMIDIQIPLTAPEEHGYTPRENLIETEYNTEKDVTFYPGMAQTYFSVMPGQMAIYFPTDGHAPGITPIAIRKAIFKVKA